jgi:exopolysaccharide biosynthesis protein
LEYSFTGHSPYLLLILFLAVTSFLLIVLTFYWIDYLSINKYIVESFQQSNNSSLNNSTSQNNTYQNKQSESKTNFSPKKDPKDSKKRN